MTPSGSLAKNRGYLPWLKPDQTLSSVFEHRKSMLMRYMSKLFYWRFSIDQGSAYLAKNNGQHNHNAPSEDCYHIYILWLTKEYFSIRYILQQRYCRLHIYHLPLYCILTFISPSHSLLLRARKTLAQVLRASSCSENYLDYQKSWEQFDLGICIDRNGKSLDELLGLCSEKIA
jgi:hypothetical protein